MVFAATNNNQGCDWQQCWMGSVNSDQGVMRSTDDTQEWLVWNRPAQDWRLH
ncbi:hypothetical protein JAAARDRAFT_32757 [Jaapia argillacea MUCL 33604]|uniref:Uncharacterized protein n=1 Tax=Jaapia argillacea MUCL 33604 TaxID=933084 RepID=A0A067QA14_9AGAM|nr:hypothetical protein JAAARDRAFT_32757 [Jaapia argillacea MUCL 33604]